MIIKSQKFIHIIIFGQNHEKHKIGNIEEHNYEVPDEFEVITACGFVKMLPEEDEIIDLLLSKIHAI